MHKYFLTLLLLSASWVLTIAQNATNVRVRQDGVNIIVTYDLSKKSVVNLQMAIGDSIPFSELTAVKGDVGKGISSGTNKEIIWQPLLEVDSFIADDVRFQVEALGSYQYYAQNANIRTMILGTMGYSLTPQMCYGVMIGQLYKTCGWYIKGRSNFDFTQATDGLSCGVGGWIGDDMPFYKGTTSSVWHINGGFMMDFLASSPKRKNKFNTFGFYVGAGYGQYERLWQMTDDRWVTYDPTSTKGVSLGIGLMGSVYGATLMAGVNTINFQYMEIEAGIGFMF